MICQANRQNRRLQTDRRTDILMNKQADRQREKQTDKTSLEYNIIETKMAAVLVFLRLKAKILKRKI
jgi:hypothetical protein